MARLYTPTLPGMASLRVPLFRRRMSYVGQSVGRLGDKMSSRRVGVQHLGDNCPKSPASHEVSFLPVQPVARELVRSPRSWCRSATLRVPYSAPIAAMHWRGAGSGCGASRSPSALTGLLAWAVPDPLGGEQAATACSHVSCDGTGELQHRAPHGSGTRTCQRTDWSDGGGVVAQGLAVLARTWCRSVRASLSKRKPTEAERKADDGPVRQVHLFVGTSADDKRRTRP
jgi:hypothetical protein